MQRYCEKKRTRQISKEKIAKSLYFTYAMGRPYQPIAMKFCTFVKVTNVINRVDLGVYACTGLVSAKGRFWSSTQTQPRCSYNNAGFPLTSQTRSPFSVYARLPNAAAGLYVQSFMSHDKQLPKLGVVELWCASRS